MNYSEPLEGPVLWYVVRVKPQCEWKADVSLSGRGFETFLPTCSKPVTPRSRKSQKPLFPGYLFCRFNARQTLPVVSTPGVMHLISFGSVPAPVDEQEIFNLQTLSSLNQPLSTWPRYEGGKAVMITAGPLANVVGFVVRDNGKTRLLVSVSLLQRTVTCEIEREWLEAVADEPFRRSAASFGVTV